jgi:hypothetical protein
LLLGFGGIVVGARIAYLLGVLLYRVLIRPLPPRRYALVVETSGNQNATLAGTDRGEWLRIEGEILAAIEEPPDEPRAVRIRGDLVIGDKMDDEEPLDVGLRVRGQDRS